MNSPGLPYNNQLYTPPAQPMTDTDYFGRKDAPKLAVNVDMEPRTVPTFPPPEGTKYISPVDKPSPDVETPAGVGPANFIPNMSQYRFLLVDDNSINLKILTKILLRLYPRAHIVELSDSTSVMSYLASTPPFDCVFLDIEMPVVSGTELAHRIRQSPELCQLPLIAVTTRTEQEDLAQYRDVGIDWTFGKPFNYPYRVVLDVVDNVLRQRIHEL
ncbi:Stress response regulator protein 1 [Meyerozyma sp. JA9]|nr:Stress response regulator protein 1 [Meyerozyma sp. JA9]